LLSLLESTSAFLNVALEVEVGAGEVGALEEVRRERKTLKDYKEA